MSAEWTRHDESTHYVNLARGGLLVAVIYDRLGTPGWKVQAGKRSLKDKISSLDDAKKVALAFADRVLKECQAELDTLKPQTETDKS